MYLLIHLYNLINNDECVLNTNFGQRGTKNKKTSEQTEA